MTYITGGPIQATDYNTFATLASSMNEVYADLHPGATTLPNAGYGYGQTALISVSAGNAVLATEWASLFNTMRNSGTHQGTTVVPPLPISNPASGAVIEAFNTPSTLASLVSTLRTNRFNVALGQSTLVSGTSYTQPGAVIPWTNSLAWTAQVNVSTWNNARYFFNSGGSILLNGSYSTPVTPEDIQWNAMLAAMSPLVFKANSTTPNSGTGGTSIGFYGLTTTYQIVYTKTYGGGGAYTNSYVKVEAKLNAVAGTNGLIDFKVSLIDGDATPAAKTIATTYQINSIKSSGAVVYPGPPVGVSTVGANSGFTAT